MTLVSPERMAGDRDRRASFQVLSEDCDRILCREWRMGAYGNQITVLAVRPTSEHAAPPSLDRLTREYDLKDELDSAWAARPQEIVRDQGRTTLLLEDPGGELLDGTFGFPMEMGTFLRIAIGLSAVLGKVHQRGLVHKDIKPSNILVNRANGEVRLTGFGITSRLPRERQAPDPPEIIAGTLAYMAPEQTGRMNRSIDARSDLYALGVTLYEMLTGSLPFKAADPMEWVYCHIARRPLTPAERVETIPEAVSAIVMKLLAKTAEERYQTAAGVESDLKRCLAEWERMGRIETFPLGEHDSPDRLAIPEKLYGRKCEIDTLLAAFDRVVTTATPELVLVSGYSGIGKSSVVNELHKVLVPPRGLFASGKFDQYKRDIPYATLAQAFQGLTRMLLSKSESELAGWRDALREALGPNGQLMVDLVPELKLIIGEQPPVPPLPSQDAQHRRFLLVFRRFIGVFARPEHPLALFLDDLQWLDAATLDLIEDLVTQRDVRHLLVIGAYRDNEVSAAHPLMRKFYAIRQAGAAVEEITLQPLAVEDLSQLIADSLHCRQEAAAPLAQLVHDKTAGNPFFAIQFFSMLAEEGLIAFDHSRVRWSWDVDSIHAKGYTENVVDLMVRKLSRLPVKTKHALQQLACIGNSADGTVLSVVLKKSEAEVHAALWEATRQELIAPFGGGYRFVHDRVQEAAYSLIPEGSRARAHLRIGRLLTVHTPPENLEEAIFEIVGQLNRGAALMRARNERERLAAFNLMAGKRARASAAYASALSYFVAGRELLTADCWKRRRKLAFELELHRAECEFLTGRLAAAEDRLIALSSRAANTIERAAVACLLIDLYATLSQNSRAVEVGLEYFRHLGIDWSPHPTNEDVRRDEYERICSLIGNREIEELVDLPLMTDPASLATLDVLTKVAAPAYLSDANLHSLVICRAAALSIERGNTDASCPQYVWLGMVAGARFGDYKTGMRFGELGCKLVEQRGLQRFQGRTYSNFGCLVAPWTKNLRAYRELLDRGMQVAKEIGDLPYQVYSICLRNTNLLAAGDPLAEVQREVEDGREFVRKTQSGYIGVIHAQLGLIRMLRGMTSAFASFNDAEFDEVQFEQDVCGNPALPVVECMYWIRKLQARFLAGDYATAAEASRRAQKLLWVTASLFETAEYHFYSALVHAAWCDPAASGQRQQRMEAIAAHHRQLEAWAETCPETFESRAALVGAEIARLEGRELDAEHLYEQAIRSAYARGFIQNEALANELAGRFYLDRGLEKNAYAHLRDARACYELWGADGKVKHLDRLYPHLAVPQRRCPTVTTGFPVQQLDAASVVRASQALSSEIELPELIKRLMTITLENAGANRGLLILPAGDDFLVQAEAKTSGDEIEVARCQMPITGTTCPETLLRYVIRTQERVILDDASKPNLFSKDDYLCRQPAKSILGLPLLKQGRLAGLLYLENTATSHAFTPHRVAILETLVVQAAISLENTRLYSDLQEREAKIRRLVDANIIGIVIGYADGRILEANDAFLRMVGYDREDLVSGRVRWTDLTPPEWRERDEQLVAEIKFTGVLQPFEKEYFRKDGSRVPVLLGVAAFGGEDGEAVAFVLDLTESKRAEAAARESEVQKELAHANRVATMGQLTASVAHEVAQPIAATITNAQAALRWLDARPPDQDEVRQALCRIVRDGCRAGDVLCRIRDLVKKRPPRTKGLDINEVILETMTLTRAETLTNGISVQAQLAKDLPVIRGDRVQLEQAILNLIINANEAMSGLGEGPRELLIGTERSEPEGVLVTVRDTGPGVNAESLSRIFEPLYTTKPDGMGMGLSICQSIIEAHAGRLWATANSPRGTTFHFILPASAAALP